MPGMPYHLLTFDSLSHICAPLGGLLGLDAPTVKQTRPSIARMRIALDLRRKRYDKVQLEVWDENGEISDFWQHVVYELWPEFCSVCETVSHKPGGV